MQNPELMNFQKGGVSNANTGAEKRIMERLGERLRKVLKKEGKFGMMFIMIAREARRIRKGAGKYHGCIAGWRRK
ncbi:MAG: hypothetical protein LUD16_03325 [Lachnospiraceae bacterium]|nr:hypothetical protein [Lachnospiraceae bacterium]